MSLSRMIRVFAALLLSLVMVGVVVTPATAAPGGTVSGTVRTANGAALSDDPVRFADDRLRFFAGEG